MARWNKKYRITLEDENSLEKRVNFSAPATVLVLFLVAFTVLAGAIGIFVLASTPMKNILPGYLKESERTATEEQHLRLDSLVKIYEVNEAYINGILAALNPTESSPQRVMSKKPVRFSMDSLKGASEDEKNFMEQIRERDKYNIATTPSFQRGTMMLSSINSAAIVSEESKDDFRAEIIVPVGNPIAAVAEGKVISVASSPKSSGGYEVIIQHPNGFLSKTGHLSNVTVRQGDRVSSGQVIALATAKNGVKNNHIILELWHDGDPLIPSRYLHGNTK